MSENVESLDFELARLRRDLDTALAAGRTCELARRSARRSFVTLARAVDLALAAPNTATRVACLRTAQKLLQEILADGFAPMPWPGVDDGDVA